MASYNPPTENITQFNTSLFNQIEDTLSQAEADTLYLSKTKTDTSTAPLTTFNGQLDVKGGLTCGVQGVAGGLFQVNRRFRVNDANGNATGFLDILYGSGAEAVYTSQSLSLAQTFHRFYNCASGSATPILRLEVGDITKITNSLEVGTQGTGGSSTGDIVARAGIRLQDIATPYSFFCQLYPSGSTMNYIMNAGATTNSFHNFKAFNNAGLDRVAFQVGYDQVNVIDGLLLSTRQITSSSNTSAAHTLFTNMVSPAVLTIGGTTSTNTINGQTTFSQGLVGNINTNVINGNGNTGIKSLYTALTGTLNIGQATTTLINMKGPTTFDLNTTMTGDLTLSRTKNNSTYANYNGLTSTYIGYFSQTTQPTPISITSSTRSQLGAITNDTIGWWRIDFEVATTCITAGSITKSSTFVSDNLVSLTTPINVSGSKYTNFATQIYAIGDISYENGSFMYLCDGTSRPLGLQLIRTFATGTFNYTGSIRQIRMN